MPCFSLCIDLKKLREIPYNWYYIPKLGFKHARTFLRYADSSFQGYDIHPMALRMKKCLFG